MSEGNHLCYFCDKIYPSCFIDNHNGILVCFHCNEFILPINFNNLENGECCICFENKCLITLPSCIHKICLECCKTIYFGSTTSDRPVHWRELTDEHPIFPYLEDIDDIKQEEYFYFEELYFDYQTKTYDEIIIVRNSLITERPEWMNTETFINYENQNIRYQIKMINVEKDWDNYNEKKTRGNGKCPLCREKPL